MRGLASEKNSSSVIPYERYGSFVKRSRCTAAASSRDAGPFDGRTILSVTNALKNGTVALPPRAIV